MLKAFFSDIEQTIICALEKATSSVKIAVAWFTNPEIFKVVEWLHEKDIELQIIVSDNKANFAIAGQHFKTLIDKNVQVRISLFPNLMHHKFCLIDNHALITGSYNWTKAAENYNHENVVLTTEYSIVNQYVTAFDALWTETNLIEFSEVDRFANKSDNTGLRTILKEVDRINLQGLLDAGCKFGPVRKYRSHKRGLYVTLILSSQLLKEYDLGTTEDGEPKDTVFLHFTKGAKKILEETDNRLSKSRMEVVERESPDGTVELLVCAKGEQISNWSNGIL